MKVISDVLYPASNITSSSAPHWRHILLVRGTLQCRCFCKGEASNTIISLLNCLLQRVYAQFISFYSYQLPWWDLRELEPFCFPSYLSWYSMRQFFHIQLNHLLDPSILGQLNISNCLKIQTLSSSVGVRRYTCSKYLIIIMQISLGQTRGSHTSMKKIFIYHSSSKSKH